MLIIIVFPERNFQIYNISLNKLVFIFESNIIIFFSVGTIVAGFNQDLILQHLFRQLVICSIIFWLLNISRHHIWWSIVWDCLYKWGIYFYGTFSFFFIGSNNEWDVGHMAKRRQTLAAFSIVGIFLYQLFFHIKFLQYFTILFKNKSVGNNHKKYTVLLC